MYHVWNGIGTILLFSDDYPNHCRGWDGGNPLPSPWPPSLSGASPSRVWGTRALGGYPLDSRSTYGYGERVQASPAGYPGQAFLGVDRGYTSPLRVVLDTSAG